MPKTRPNIVLITTDQQRYDSCGPAAPDFMRTPHFDHLSRLGVTFSRAYADCPLCVPSRVSVMTGKTVFGHGLGGNGDSSKVIQREQSLPSCLRELGYQTAAIGKMHFRPQRNRNGFDEMIIPEDYYTWMRHSGQAQQPMRHGLGQNELYPTLSTVPESLTLTNWIAEQALQYILFRRDPSVPFFLWVSFAKPHPPLDPPEPYYSMYRDCEFPKPLQSDWSQQDDLPERVRRSKLSRAAHRISPELIHEARSAYAGLITQIDYNMGRVFQALQDKALFNDAAILYTSDHGEFLGDHGLAAKSFFYESAAHVPFVLKTPKSFDDRSHGTVQNTPATLADILPTLVGIAGGEAPQGCDGLNLLSVIREGDRPRYLFAGQGPDLTHPLYLAVTDGDWKYLWYPEGEKEQLFHVKEDPGESVNRAGQAACAEHQERLKTELLRYHENHEGLIQDGMLVGHEIERWSDRDCEADVWPGYHTEYFQKDLRH